MLAATWSSSYGGFAAELHRAPIRRTQDPTGVRDEPGSTVGRPRLSSRPEFAPLWRSSERPGLLTYDAGACWAETEVDSRRPTL